MTSPTTAGSGAGMTVAPTAPPAGTDEVERIMGLVADRLSAEREWRDAYLCAWETELERAKEHGIHADDALRSAIVNLAARLAAMTPVAVAEFQAKPNVVRTAGCWQCDSSGYVVPSNRIRPKGGSPSLVKCGVCGGTGSLIAPIVAVTAGDGAGTGGDA